MQFIGFLGGLLDIKINFEDHELVYSRLFDMTKPQTHRVSRF